MPETLGNPQIRKLKAIAQRLEATLKVGKQGLSEPFLKAFDEELARHQLVKVKFVEFKEQKKTLAAELAIRSGAHLVMLVGHVAVFFRQNENPERRKIQLPAGAKFQPEEAQSSN